MRFALRRILYLALCLMLFCQAALAYETLENGSSGNDVLRMQLALTRLGYAVSCDGTFGTETVNAVKLFQRDNNLEVDGKAGNETLTLLYSMINDAAAVMTVSEDAAQPAEIQATVYCENGGKLKNLADICICVPETETFKVQELHLPVYHYLCAETEAHFYSE